MVDLGLSLRSIELGHPRPHEFERTLHTHGVADLATVRCTDEPSLSFVMQLPAGGTATLA